jgi:hypothetical protein
VNVAIGVPAVDLAPLFLSQFRALTTPLPPIHKLLRVLVLVFVLLGMAKAHTLMSW